jgi:hypothetical protein
VARPDISRDQLRRELRDAAVSNAADTRAMRPVLEAFLSSDATGAQRVDALLGRRRFITIGGFSVATATVLAACAESDSGGIARVGVAPTVTALPPAIVSDIALLRTASSLEHSAIAVYDAVIGNDDLLDQAAYGDIAKRFRDDHAGHAALFEQLTEQLGGVPWSCGNPRLDEVVVGPILRAITGGAKTEQLAETPASDDPKRDVLNFAHALESIAGATYQSLVPALSDPRLRREAIVIGTHEVRHAALLAIAITGAPDGYVDPADVQAATLEVPTTTAAPTTTQDIAAPTTVEGAEPPPPPTPIPRVYAIPGAFGKLGAVQLVVGKPNESGTRLTVNLETPSLNSFVYEYMQPACS